MFDYGNNIRYQIIKLGVNINGSGLRSINFRKTSFVKDLKFFNFYKIGPVRSNTNTHLYTKLLFFYYYPL